MSRADLVIVPTKGSELDAIEAIKVIKFIGRQERAYNKVIPFAVLFTQTNPAVRPRTLKSLEKDLLSQGVPLFGTALHERDAFRAIFSFGGTLSGLSVAAVSNVDAALANARKFTTEVVALLSREKVETKRAVEAA
jgi:chromosome partitioning protein